MSFAYGLPLTGQSSEWLSMILALWAKSIIMLATAALLTFLLRSASARLRHTLWCAALSSLLTLPLFTGMLQPLRLPVLPSRLFPDEVTTQQASLGTAEELSGQTSDTFPSGSGSQSEQSGRSNVLPVEDQPVSSGFSWQTVILLVWLTGVLVVLGRLVVGIVRVRHLVRRATELTGTSWPELSSELSQQLRLKHSVPVFRSDKSIMPMTCEGISAVVLLPNESARWPADRRRVILLHELAHIKRRDLLTQTLAQIVCALYWFNPLVWWAVRKLRTEQEWACDELVVASGIGRSDYAAHLLDIARNFRVDRTSAVTTTAMARHSALQERLCAILSPTHESPRSGRMFGVSAIVMSLVFISTAVTQLVTAQRRDETNLSSITGDVTQVGQDDHLTRLSEQTTAPAGTVSEETQTLHQIPSPTPTIQPVDSPAASQETVENQTGEQVFNTFSVEERDRLINNGIGPAYIKEMSGAGYRGLTIAQLIALYSNAVHADYVAVLRSVGYSGLSTADLLALKTNGITPDVIRSFQAVKYADFRATNYIAFRSNGVTPSYLKSLSAAGYDRLTPKQIVDMCVAGVTPEFIRDARSHTNNNLLPEELIELKRRERR